MQNPALTDIFFSTASLSIKLRKCADFVMGSTAAFFLRKPRKLSKAPEKFKNILIIRPGGIGDAVMLIPLIKALREQHPDITIDILCEKRNATIFKFQADLINNIICYDVKGFIPFLRKQKYDITIDTEQWHYLSAIIASIKAEACSIGFNTRSLRAKLFHLDIPFNHNGYEFENFISLFRPLLKNTHNLSNINASLTVPAHIRQWAQTELNTDTVTLFLGGSISIRRLDADKAVELLHYITSIGYQPVLIGGPGEEKLGLEIMKSVNPSNTLNYINKISLIESAGLIQRSRLFIGCDSGPLHIAAAVGAPTIGIFGPGNREKWRPRGEGHEVVYYDIPCAPCTKFGYTVPTCHHTYGCMKKIDVKHIINTVNKILTP